MAEFIYFFTGGLCCYFSFVFPLPCKLHWTKHLIILMYIYSICLLLGSRFGQLSTFFVVIGILILIYHFTESNFYSLSCSLFGYLHTITANYLILWLIGIILHISEGQLVSSSKLSIIFNTSYCLLCAISTKLIGYLMNEKLCLDQYLNDSHTLKGIFSFLFLLVILFIFHVSYGEILGYSYGVTAFSGISFLLLFIIAGFLMHSIYQHTRQAELAKSQIRQFEDLLTYTKKLEESYQTMRRFKHDYINIFTTISSFINNDDLPALKEYYQQKIIPLSQAFIESNHKLNDLMHISCQELKSVLSSKLIYSMELNITTELEIKETIKEIYIDSLDVSIVVGIFLDNAIEAALESKEKELHLAIFYKNDFLFILIRNSTLPLNKSIYEIRQFGISSKGNMRGIGLYNVSHILNKYPNVLWDTIYEPPYFLQELKISPQKR